MRDEYIPLDDPRVTLHCTRPGHIYHQNGGHQVVDGALTYRFDRYEDGLHQEPRMTAVMAPVRTWNLNKGDWAEIDIEDVAMIGIAMELAEHHWDVDLLIDGEKVYGAWYTVPTYLPANDGYGYIHWMMLPRGQHTIRLEVSGRYNRMLDLSDILPSHACINGFVLLRNLTPPPPLYHAWMFSQDEMPTFTTDFLPGSAKGRLEVDQVPAGGSLYLMDLPGRGTLDVLTLRVDRPVALEIIDGGIAQVEFPRDFPAWIRRVDCNHPESGAFGTIFDLHSDDDGFKLTMSRPAVFGHRLMVRLINGGDDPARISSFYMEGTMKCM